MDTVEQTKNGAKELVEERGEEIQEAAEEVSVSLEPEVVHSKDKFMIAKNKLEEAKRTLSRTDEEVEECLKKIDADLADFKSAHERLSERAIKPARELLGSLGVDERIVAEQVAMPEVEAVDSSITPVEVPPISRGTFKALSVGLLGTVVAVGAWCYVATQALGLPVIPEKFPDLDRLNKALGWTATQLGQGENVAVGAALVGIGALVIGGLFYGITKALRSSHNVTIAKKVEEETEFYCTKKGECKQQMERIRTHIAHAKKTVEMYTVLLDELRAKLNRARFIEEADTFGALHAKTQKDIEAANKLISEVTVFLQTPMAQSGVLNKEGIDALEKATEEANRYVMELYA